MNFIAASAFIGFISLAAADQNSTDPVPPLIGSPAPEFKLEALLQAPDEATTTGEGLKGNVVVLEFWATWCGPCVGAIPHINDLADKFDGKPVRFISITDEDRAVIDPFLKKRLMKGWIGLDTDRSVFNAYGVKGIPRLILIGVNGDIVADTHPTFLTEGLLSDVLAGRNIDLPPMDIGEVVPSIREAEETAAPPLLQVSIRPTTRADMGCSYSANEITGLGWTLLDMIAAVYEMPTRRIEIPSEFCKEKFEFTVVVPPDKEESLRPYARQAIETAFSIEVRREARESDVYVMTVDNGAGKGLRATAATSNSHFHSASPGEMVVVNKELSEVAEIFERVLGKPVVIEKGLEGRFDFELSYGEDQAEPLMKAAKENLGLEIRPGRRPIEVLVVQKTTGGVGTAQSAAP